MSRLCRILVMIAVLFLVVVLGSGRNPSKTTPTAANQPDKPSLLAQQQQPAPEKSYDPANDRIWTSMVHGKNYIRNSPSRAGAVEFLQRADDVQITVPAPAAGTVTSIRNEKNYTALTLSDETGKLYHYYFSKAMVKMGQKVTKSETLGFRPGVFRVPVTLIGPGDKPFDPRPFLPPIRELPPGADKP